MHMHLAIHVISKKTRFIQPGDLLPLLGGPGLTLLYPFFGGHFCSGWGSAWAPLPLCTNKASSATNCNTAWSHLAIWAALAQDFVPHLTLLLLSHCSLLWSFCQIQTPSGHERPPKLQFLESTQSDNSCQTGSDRLPIFPSSKTSALTTTYCLVA